MFSKAAIAATLLTTAGQVSAHQTFTQFWVNDQTPGFQKAMRLPPNNSPIVDMTSADMACNTNGNKVPSGVSTFPAKEGDTITAGWSASAHPGPISHFLYGPVDDASSATGVGTWVKINEANQTDGVWATVIMNNAMKDGQMNHSFQLPTGLQSGEYLLRSEILALHVSQSPGGGQFYMGCAQLKITGTGTAPCGPTVQIPGDPSYNASSPAIYIPNYYNGFKPQTYICVCMVHLENFEIFNIRLLIMQLRSGAPGGPVATCPGGSGASTAPGGTPAAPVAADPAPAPPSSGNNSSSNASAADSSSNNHNSAGPTAAGQGKIALTASTVASTNSLGSASAEAPAPAAVPAVAAPSPPTTGGTTSDNATSGATPPPGGETAPLWGQCGGKTWTGPTTCAGGVSCVATNEFYSQCLNQAPPTNQNAQPASTKKRTKRMANRFTVRRLDTKIVKKPH